MKAGPQWKHVDLEGRKLQIRQSLCHGQLVSTKTEGSARTLSGEALAAALRGSTRNGPNDYVFCKQDGAPLHPDVLRKDVLYPILDRLGISRQPRSSGFHRFRNSVGSFVNAQTGNLKLAQKFLGHSNISTTPDIYTHTSEESEREAALAVERAIYGDLFSILRTRTAADQFSRAGKIMAAQLRSSNKKGHLPALGHRRPFGCGGWI